MNRPSLFDPCRKRGSGREVSVKTVLTVPTAAAMSKAATHAMAEAVAYVVAAGNAHTHAMETATAEMADTYDAVVETHAVIDDVPTGARAMAEAVAEAIVVRVLAIKYRGVAVIAVIIPA